MFLPTTFLLPLPKVCCLLSLVCLFNNSLLAPEGDPTGLFLYAISIRHGWYVLTIFSTQPPLTLFKNHIRGVPKDEKEAFRLLELVTESVGLVSVPNEGIVHAYHIPLALYEVSYRVTLLRYG